MVKVQFEMKINYKRNKYKTSKGGSVIGGYFYDKDIYGMINLEFSCFNDLAELVDSLPIGTKIAGEGTLKNKAPYNKDAKEEDNNAREILISKITKYMIWDEMEKRFITTECNVGLTKTSDTEYDKNNEYTQNKPKEQAPQKQELHIEDDDLPF